MTFKLLIIYNYFLLCLTIQFYERVGILDFTDITNKAYNELTSTYTQYTKTQYGETTLPFYMAKISQLHHSSSLQMTDLNFLCNLHFVYVFYCNLKFKNHI